MSVCERGARTEKASLSWAATRLSSAGLAHSQGVTFCLRAITGWHSNILAHADFGIDPVNFIFVTEKLPEMYLYGFFEDAKFINLKS